MRSLFKNYKIIILLISQFVFGQDPPNINWKQINTKHYDIIFPYEIQNEALRVGPRSAGANPGPACYGKNGKEPTVTDANLFLGRLGKESKLGGWMDLDIFLTRIKSKIHHGFFLTMILVNH